MSEIEFAREVNKSKSYILPLFVGTVDIQFVRFIQNTYLFLKPNQKFEHRILHILYNKEVVNQPLFDSYLNEVKNTSWFVDYQEVLDGYLLSLRIPEKHIKDYDYFSEGKYSKFDDLAKKKILYHLYDNYPELSDLIKKIEYILYKNEKLKKAWEDKLDARLPDELELSSVINPENETYNLLENN